MQRLMDSWKAETSIENKEAENVISLTELGGRK
jgi:hypothetical protein